MEEGSQIINSKRLKRFVRHLCITAYRYKSREKAKADLQERFQKLKEFSSEKELQNKDKINQIKESINEIKEKIRKYTEMKLEQEIKIDKLEQKITSQFLMEKIDGLKKRMTH